MGDVKAVEKLQEAREQILGELRHAIVGMDDVIDQLMIAIFARGRVLSSARVAVIGRSVAGLRAACKVQRVGRARAPTGDQRQPRHCQSPPSPHLEGAVPTSARFVSEKDRETVEPSCMGRLGPEFAVYERHSDRAADPDRRADSEQRDPRGL